MHCWCNVRIIDWITALEYGVPWRDKIVTIDDCVVVLLSLTVTVVSFTAADYATSPCLPPIQRLQQLAVVAVADGH